MIDQSVTRNQIAKICLVTACTVRNWEKKGKLKVAYNINGRPRYSLEDVQALLSNSKNVTNYPVKEK